MTIYGHEQCYILPCHPAIKKTETEQKLRHTSFQERSTTFELGRLCAGRRLGCLCTGPFRYQKIRMFFVRQLFGPNLGVFREPNLEVFWGEGKPSYAKMTLPK